MTFLLQLELKTRPPYSFQHSIRRLLNHHSEFEYREDVLYRAMRLWGRPLLIAVSWKEDDPLTLSVQVKGAKEADQEKIKRRLRHIFSLDRDLTPFYRIVALDSKLAKVIEQRKGLRPVLDPSLYECLIKTIIGQQINVSFAATLIQRLTTLAGDKVTWDGKEYLVFPDPEQVAKLDYSTLQQMQFNRRKAEYIIDISRQIVNGKIDLEQLYELEDEAAIEELVKIRGVGRWTAECLLLFGLGRRDLLPAADIGLRNAIRFIYQLDHQPTEQEVRAMGQKWAPWRSDATFYLWDALTYPPILNNSRPI